MNEIWNVVMQAASLSAGLGACASALATFFTVREMRKQRETAHKPDLFFSGCILTGPLENLETCAAADLCSPKAKMMVNNIGLGAAKRVEIRLHCPKRADISSSLNATLRNAGCLLSVELDERQIVVLRNHENDAQETYSETSFGSVSLNYILPMGDDAKEIPVDARLLLLVQIMACAIGTYGSREAKQLLQQFCFALSVSYCDSENREVRHDLRITIQDVLLNHDLRTYTARLAVA